MLLVGRVAHLFAEGYRLVQVGCNTLQNGYELNYSFDRGYQFKNLRISVAPGEVPFDGESVHPTRHRKDRGNLYGEDGRGGGSEVNLPRRAMESFPR